MSLTLVSVPIGHPKDITLRALETLQKADFIICEEIRPAQTYLKMWDIADKELMTLNEHSKPQDVQELVELCRENTVALISDAGTPGFCDPGSDLVSLCRKAGIEIDVNPGASSLMALIALSGVKLTEFLFVGFLPPERVERKRRIDQLKSEKRTLIFMDTAYRLKATIADLSEVLGNHQAVLGMDLTTHGQKVVTGSLEQLAKKDFAKAPFVLLLRN